MIADVAAPSLSGYLIVDGMPGSGKTMVTRPIADMLPRTALLRSEYVAELVASGRIWALGEARRSGSSGPARLPDLAPAAFPARDRRTPTASGLRQRQDRGSHRDAFGSPNR
jgi:hypothetical protein